MGTEEFLKELNYGQLKLNKTEWPKFIDAMIKFEKD